MTDSDLIREALKKKANAKRDPEFYAAQEELAHKLAWGEIMQNSGRLSKADLAEFRAHLIGDYLTAMPTEMFVEMRKSGAYDDLEALASHDGKRDTHSVVQDRKAINKRVTQDALDEAWAAGKIDSKRYNQEHRANGTAPAEMAERITDADDVDGDHETLAGEQFFNRNLPQGDIEPITAPAEHPDTIKDASED